MRKRASRHRYSIATGMAQGADHLAKEDKTCVVNLADTACEGTVRKPEMTADVPENITKLLKPVDSLQEYTMLQMEVHFK